MSLLTGTASRSTCPTRSDADHGLTETVGRRTFLKVLGSAGPAAAAAACSPVPPERIIPFVIPPDDVVPGVATWYASVCGECPTGCGVLVKTREGRAIKVEGNPQHPVSRGGLCIRGQSSLQGLYDPDRYRQPLRRRDGEGRDGFAPVSWAAAEAEVAERIAALLAAGRGDRIAVVTPALTGSLDALCERWCRAMVGARHLRYEAYAWEAMRAANRALFGRATVPYHDFGRAELVVSFGADFLETWLATVAHMRDYADARRPDAATTGARARSVHFEPRLSLTASNADEWIAIEPGSEGAIAAAMVHVIVNEGRAQVEDDPELERIAALVANWTPQTAAARSGVPTERIVELARAFSDPTAGPGRTLAAGGAVAASGADGTEAAAAVALLNHVAGNIGATVRLAPGTMWDGAATYAGMTALTEAMRAGEIDLLLLHQVNPVHTMPAAADFAGAMDEVPLVVAMASDPNDTTARADIVLPVHTPLESWGDHVLATGVEGLMQPAMQPLYDTRHAGDIFLAVGRTALADAGAAESENDEAAAPLPDGEFYDVLRDRWRALQAARRDTEADAAPGAADPPEPQDFEDFWADAVRRGGLWWPVEPDPVTLSETIDALDFDRLAGASAEGARGLTLVAYPSLHFYDGRTANRPWLQEIPDPILKATWGSWIELHPETAAAIGADENQLVTVESDHGRVEATVLLNPHLHAGAAAMPIGQGQTNAGRYARGRGANPIALLDPEPLDGSGGLRWAGTRVDVTPHELHRPVHRLQRTFDQQGRGLALAMTQQALDAGDMPHEEVHLTLNPPHDHPKHRWGMAIDIDACTGCNACVAACYAENNIPVMGSDRMRLGRTMSWLRIERFVEPPTDGVAGADTRFLPMLCQHCDHAPCETVCPTYATYHTDEGLNAQVYNRCVGTRYCSNNCPYKVRRFNWFAPESPDPMHLQLNPDVTVRTRGVMEKCTFCVQRIAAGRERARDDDRPMQDGDVTPACAQSCPAQAIVFGDLNDPDSRVSQRAADARGYHALSDTNTRPAITYLRKVLR